MILLDTHALLWLASGDARLSRPAQAAIDKARQRNMALAISDVTLMEIAQRWHRRRINFPVGLESFLEEVERRFRVFPITRNIPLQAFELPANYPNDPVDRLIGATALIEDMPLITADQSIRRSRRSHHLVAHSAPQIPGFLLPRVDSTSPYLLEEIYRPSRPRFLFPRNSA